MWTGVYPDTVRVVYRRSKCGSPDVSGRYVAGAGVDKVEVISNGKNKDITMPNKLTVSLLVAGVAVAAGMWGQDKPSPFGQNPNPVPAAEVGACASR